MREADEVVVSGLMIRVSMMAAETERGGTYGMPFASEYDGQVSLELPYGNCRSCGAECFENDTHCRISGAAYTPCVRCASQGRWILGAFPVFETVYTLIADIPHAKILNTSVS